MVPETAPACTTCGHGVPPNARFCPSCGARLAEHEALRPEEGGEHRQITVIFCDLVGSTSLSSQLHSEDLRELLREYQAICAEAIEARGGMIAQFLGDGIMAYFGYPRAMEDAATRAADAGLEIVDRIVALGRTLVEERGIDLATRISMHTGRVLIGEMGAGGTREHHSVTGVVPNLAARLESFAPVNGIVVSGATAALIAGSYELDPVERAEVRGIPEPVDIYRLVARTPVTSVLPAGGTELVGRERELGVLHKAFERIRGGDSARVTVVAEAGSGKSTLAATFLTEAGIDRGDVIELAGSLVGRNAPFAALSDAIGRWLEKSGAPDATDTRSRIAGWFPPETPGLDVNVEVLHSLWQGDIETGREGRSAIFAACAAVIAELGEPLLIVVDDANWVDASTLEMLDRFFSARTVACMLLILARPGFDTVWSDPREVSLTLSGLDADACARLVEATAGASVEFALTRRIFEATSGLPLYVEEMTRALIASGHVREERGVVRAVELTAETATPASLLDLITERLDMLGPAKLIAQIGAVLGRTFEPAALVDVSGRPAETVNEALSALSMAGILSRARGGRLTFRHALYQAAAYESLVRKSRRIWHERYLAWLERDPDRLAATRPETVGFHLECCDRLEQAVDKYLDAGLAAQRSSASLEAAAHFRKCADLLARLAAAQDARADLPALRLRVQVLLASALLSARGPGAAQTRSAYEAALALAEETPESEFHFPAYWGWWRVSDNFATMAHRAHRLLEVSERMQGQEFKLQAKHCVWANAFQMGELAESIDNAREGLALYEAGGFEDLGTLYGGHDCKVCALGEIALAEWLQGAGDSAVAQARAAVEHAERLGHLGSLVHALDIAVMLHHYRRSGRDAAEVSRRLLAIAGERDLEEYRAKAGIFLGWVDIDAGRTADGLARVEGGLDILREIGTPEDFPVYQCMRAEALSRQGDTDAALRALAEGRAIIKDQGVNYWGAEIARHEAEAEMARDEPNTAFVASRLAEAHGIAVAQGALMLEMRARLSALNWVGRSGRTGGAEAALAQTLSRFRPGASGRDLDEARAALARARR